MKLTWETRYAGEKSSYLYFCEFREGMKEWSEFHKCEIIEDGEEKDYSYAFVKAIKAPKQNWVEQGYKYILIFWDLKGSRYFDQVEYITNMGKQVIKTDTIDNTHYIYSKDIHQLIDFVEDLKQKMIIHAK